MKRRIVLTGIICLSLLFGTIYGYHAALSDSLPVKAILKTAYAIERYHSVSDPPDEFMERWEEQINDFSREHRIGVYVGEGTNATPFFPLQLEKMGFDVMRFGHDEFDFIKDCSAIIFPGGHYSLEWDEQTIRVVREHVSSGGGFIGVCLGCVAAQKMGLIQADLMPCPFTGLVSCKTDPAFFGRDKIRFLHMNGRILAKSDLSPLATWGDNVMAGMKEYGKGRVVLFSSHPEGGKIEYGSRYVLAEGTSLGTMDMLLTAIFYVTGG